MLLTFCIMGNHFHIVVRMHPGTCYSDEQIKERFVRYYGDKKNLTAGQIPMFREKWAKLSEFMKEIKQYFSRYYNKLHKRRGFFWADRYKSVIVEEGETLINCLAYVDLNPVRAGIVDKPDDYRWNGLGWHAQTGNRDRFLSVDFGLEDHNETDISERLARYREFVYEAGAVESGKGKSISDEILKKARAKGFKPTLVDRMRAAPVTLQISREFVRRLWGRLRADEDNPEKIPVSISGIPGMYSLKRLPENI